MKRILLLLFSGFITLSLVGQTCTPVIIANIDQANKVKKSDGTHINSGDNIWVCKGVTLDVSGDGNGIYAEENCIITLSGDNNTLYIKQGGTVTITGTDNVVEKYQKDITPVDIGSGTMINDPCDTVYFDYTNTPDAPVACDAKYVGIKDVKTLKTEISIYPNPVRDNLFIRLKGNMEIESFRIFSITGQIEKSQTVQGKLESINTGNLNSGLYFLQLQTSQGIVSHRFTVE